MIPNIVEKIRRLSTENPIDPRIAIFIYII